MDTRSDFFFYNQRNIAINLQKLEIIFKVYLKDAVEYLATPIGTKNTNLFLREDSPGSDCSELTNSSDEVELEEQEHRIIEYIDQQIKNLVDNEDILTSNDRESFIAGAI